MTKKVVVTGAGGLVGSHIVSLLSLQKSDVIAVYNSQMWKNDKLMSLQLDLTHNEAFEELGNMPIDAMIHCAAAIPQDFFDDDALKVAKINRKIDDNVIRFCEQRRIRLLFLSTCSIYGLNHMEKKSEMAESVLLGPYAEEKYRTENLISNSAIVSPVILRISSPYGKNQRNKTVLKLFLERALKNEDIFYYSSGTREQDFINCRDIAAAVDKILSMRDISGVFNIAYGQSITMRQLAERIVHAVGSKSKVKKLEQADPQDGFKCKIDISKAKQLLNWEPQVSIEEGINYWTNI